MSFSGKGCRHALLLAAVFGLGLVLNQAAADAQGRRAQCGEYAQQAVEQQRQNQKRRCGYDGPRWNDAQAAHLAWCLIDPKQAARENDARERLLRECGERRADRRDERRRDRRGKEASCDTYSRIAEVQAEANDRYDCGYDGDEWNTNARDHRRWCMHSKREYTIDEIRYRAMELQKCFNKLGDYDEDGDRNYRRRRFDR